MLKLTETKAILLVVILATTLLLIPHIIRFNYFNNYMLGQSPYHDANIAQDIMNGGEGAAYHELIALLGGFIGVLTAINLIPFAAGILATLLFYLTLKRFKLRLKNRFLITVLWILSPIYIYGFTVSNPFAVVLLLMIAGFHYFILRKFSWLSLLFFAFIPLFGWINTLLTLSLVILYTLQNKNKKWLCLITIGLMALVGWVGNAPIFEQRIIPETGNLLQDNISGLGALIGFNVFVLLLAGIGIVKSWKNKQSLAWLYAVFIGLLILSFYSSEYKILLNLLISLYGAVGFAALMNMQWELKLIRNLTIGLLAIGLLFSTVSYIHRLSYMEPSPQLVNSIVEFRNRSTPTDVVLSHPENGYWLEFFSERDSYLDSSRESFNETLAFFMTRDEDRAAEYLDNREISFIFVDHKTRELMINNDNEIGLEFLMQNSMAYTLVHRDDPISIWKYHKIEQ